MNDQLDAVQAGIVAAVQHELTRYSQQVSAEVQRLRDEIATERAARAASDEQLRQLATALQRSHEGNVAFQSELQRALEERLSEFNTVTKRRHDEMNTRLGRVVDEANVGIAAAVESAARPIFKKLEHRQDKVEADLETLDGSLRKFDEQAGRMVNHVNELTSAVDARMDQIAKQVLTNFDERIASLAIRIDEVSAAASRQQAEVSNIVGSRVDQAEDRLNERIQTTEARMNEELGQRVADIDAHVGRVSAGLDDSVNLLNDRIASADSKFSAVEQQIADIQKSVEAVDAEAIDEIKERVMGAVGEAELVRIEMERFQKSVTENLDKTAVRITELETTVQDQTMDVESAIQLERLEEVERAVMSLDPDQFVRRDEMSKNGAASSNGSAERPLSAPPADAGSVGSFDPPVSVQ